IPAPARLLPALRRLGAPVLAPGVLLILPLEALAAVAAHAHVSVLLVSVLLGSHHLSPPDRTLTLTRKRRLGELAGGAGKHDIHSAVLLPAGRRVVGGHRVGLP